MNNFALRMVGGPDLAPGQWQHEKGQGERGSMGAFGPYIWEISISNYTKIVICMDASS